MSELSVLTRYSTPTVANAIELFELRPRNEGFLRLPFHCLLPAQAPVAGYAATCLVSSEQTDSFGRKETFDYWEHLESQPGPRITVVQDLDPAPAAGSFFGEVNANLHLAMNCVGAVTDGAVRDLDEMKASGFQVYYREASVSHACIHVVDFGKPVNLGGVLVRPGDLLQLDQHGVLIVPPQTLPDLEDAIREVERRERPVIEYARSGKATRQGLVEAVTRHIRDAGPWKPI